MATLGWTASLTGGMAQEVLAPPTSGFAPQTPLFHSPGSNQVINPVFASALPPNSAAQGLFHWGSVHLRPHFLFRFSYADGIQSQPGKPSQATIIEVLPGMLLELGRHWTLDYTPTLRYYSNRRFFDTTDHAVSLEGQTTYEDWVFDLVQRYNASTSLLIETGSQTDQQLYITEFDAVRHLNSDLSLEFGLSQHFRLIGENRQELRMLTDSHEWSTLNWLNYRFWPDFSAGIGVGFGYNDLKLGSDMTYEQLQGRVTWKPGAKFSVSVNSGFEVRQFLDSSAPELFNPIFGASVHYQLFDLTALSLNASRVVSSSYFQDLVNETTTVEASIRQRLLQRLYLVVGGGYGHTSYINSLNNLQLQRADDYTFFDVRLSVSILKNGSVAVFYHGSENSSNDRSFGYSSSQTGAELGYHF